MLHLSPASVRLRDSRSRTEIGTYFNRSFIASSQKLINIWSSLWFPPLLYLCSSCRGQHWAVLKHQAAVVGGRLHMHEHDRPETHMHTHTHRSSTWIRHVTWKRMHTLNFLLIWPFRQNWIRCEGTLTAALGPVSTLINSLHLICSKLCFKKNSDIVISHSWGSIYH